MQEINDDEEFALPFWDWTENPTRCDPAICSEELLGVTDQTTGIVRGKYLNDWYVLCTREQTDNLTKSCDPTDKRNGLKRNTDDEKEKKEKEQRYDMTFPKKQKSTSRSVLKPLTVHPTTKVPAVVLETS